MTFWQSILLPAPASDISTAQCREQILVLRRFLNLLKLTQPDSSDSSTNKGTIDQYRFLRKTNNKMEGHSAEGSFADTVS